jgi:hypothetical protein
MPIKADRKAILESVKSKIPLVGVDPALQRQELETHFSDSNSLGTKVARADLNTPVGNGQGLVVFDALAARAAKATKKGYQTYGSPDVYRANYQGQKFFVIDYNELRPGLGGWAARAVVAEGGQLLAVGTQQLDSAAPVGGFTWLEPALPTTKGIRVSSAPDPADEDKWDITVIFEDGKYASEVLGHSYDGFERLAIETNDPFIHSPDQAKRTFETKYVANESTVTKAETNRGKVTYSLATHGYNEIPARLKVRAGGREDTFELKPLKRGQTQVDFF